MHPPIQSNQNDSCNFFNGFSVNVYSYIKYQTYHPCTFPLSSEGEEIISVFIVHSLLLQILQQFIAVKRTGCSFCGLVLLPESSWQQSILENGFRTDVVPVILWNFNILSFHATLHTINCLLFKWIRTIICLVMMIGRSEPEHYMSKLCCLLHFCLIGKIAEICLLKRKLLCLEANLSPVYSNKQTESCLWGHNRNSSRQI